MFDSKLERIVVVAYLLAMGGTLARMYQTSGECAALGFVLALLSLAAGYIVERH